MTKDRHPSVTSTAWKVLRFCKMAGSTTVRQNGPRRKRGAFVPPLLGNLVSKMFFFHWFSLRNFPVGAYPQTPPFPPPPPPLRAYGCFQVHFSTPGFWTTTVEPRYLKLSWGIKKEGPLRSEPPQSCHRMRLFPRLPHRPTKPGSASAGRSLVGCRR